MCIVKHVLKSYNNEVQYVSFEGIPNLFRPDQVLAWVLTFLQNVHIKLRFAIGFGGGGQLP